MAKKGMKRKVARRGLARGFSAGRSAGVVGTLTAELSQLQRERDNLDRQIDALSTALSALGGTVRMAGRRAAGGEGGGKNYRRGSLKEFIENILRSGGVMAVKDITESVMQAGYPTKNKTLAKSVGIALAQMHTVEKVGRGKFKLA
jgi:hypothetical protein